MNVFELVGTFALKGADKAKSDIQGVTGAAKSEFGEMGSKAKQASDDTSKGFGKAANAANPLTSAIKRIGGAIAAYMSVQAVKDFAQACVDAAAEVSAENSAFEQIMGGYAEQANAKMQSVADATGVVSTRLTGSMTSMTAKFKGLGFGVEDATDLAARGLTIASDAAAFWDKSLEDAQGSLNSFINGSYEGGEAIGLFANDTQMAAYAVEKGVVADTKAWANLDEATKQATRLDYAENMMALSGATGQAAKESLQYANVKANLTEKWRQFQAVVGEPIMQNVVIPAMSAISSLLDRVTPKVQEFGEKFSSFGEKASSWLSGMGSLISSAETPAEAVRLVVANLGNTLTSLAVTMLPNLIGRFTATFTTIAGILPTVLPAIVESVTSLLAAVTSALPTLIPAITGAFTQMVQAVVEMAPVLLPLMTEAGTQLFMAIVQVIPTVLDALLPALTDMVNQVAAMLPTLIPALVQAAVTMFMAFVDALPQVLDALLPAVISLVDSVGAMLPTLIPALLQAAVTLFMAIVQALPQIVGSLLSAVGSLIGSAVQYLPSFVGSVLGAAVTLFMAIAQAIPNVAGSVLGELGGLLAQLPGKVSDFAGDMADAAWNMIQGMVQGIQNAAGSVVEALSGVVNGAIDGAKQLLGIASPSKVFRAMFRWIPIGGAMGIDDEGDQVVDSMVGMAQRGIDAAGDAIDDGWPFGASSPFKASPARTAPAPDQRAQSVVGGGDAGMAGFTLEDLKEAVREGVESASITANTYLDGMLVSRRVEREMSKMAALEGGIA